MEITTSIVIKAGETKIILTRSEAKFLYEELQKWLGNGKTAAPTEPWYPRVFGPIPNKPVGPPNYTINPIK